VTQARPSALALRQEEPATLEPVPPDVPKTTAIGEVSGDIRARHGHVLDLRPGSVALWMPPASADAPWRRTPQHQTSMASAAILGLGFPSVAVAAGHRQEPAVPEGQLVRACMPQSDLDRPGPKQAGVPWPMGPQLLPHPAQDAEHGQPAIDGGRWSDEGAAAEKPDRIGPGSALRHAPPPPGSGPIGHDRTMSWATPNALAQRVDQPALLEPGANWVAVRKAGVHDRHQEIRLIRAAWGRHRATWSPPGASPGVPPGSRRPTPGLGNVPGALPGRLGRPAALAAVPDFSTEAWEARPPWAADWPPPEALRAVFWAQSGRSGPCFGPVPPSPVGGGGQGRQGREGLKDSVRGLPTT
jgi:hypothetical protein